MNLGDEIHLSTICHDARRPTFDNRPSLLLSMDIQPLSLETTTSKSPTIVFHATTNNQFLSTVFPQPPSSKLRQSLSNNHCRPNFEWLFSGDYNKTTIDHHWLSSTNNQSSFFWLLFFIGHWCIIYFRLLFFPTIIMLSANLQQSIFNTHHWPTLDKCFWMNATDYLLHCFLKTSF